LHIAAGMGRVLLARMLIDFGANINSADADGLSPLDYAVKYGHESTAKMLMSHGAEVTARDKSGRTALHNA
ncbi:ankyrin, partial [Polychaeton citri CBS 116435]